MAKREQAEPKQIPRDLIIIQCAFRKNTVSETQQYLQEAGHESTGASELAEKTKELTTQGIMEDPLDCRQAAVVIGVITRRVRAFCIAHRLGRKLSSSYIIPRDDLIRFIGISRKVGIPGQRAVAEGKAE